jgi:HAD superfamily hydrolase (TIGR01490 family)
VVAFDFDGTLTRRDTLRVFLVRVRRPPAVAAAFARHLPSVLRAYQGDQARDRAKEAVFSDILGGLDEDAAEEAASATAQVVIGSMFKPDVVARLRWHQEAGHRVIVVSASFVHYVAPAVATLGVDEVLATRWEVDPASRRLTGRFDGGNVRGAAKVDLLAQHLGRPCELEYAYGNSSGDVAMLAAARNPVWIRRIPMDERPGSDRA